MRKLVVTAEGPVYVDLTPEEVAAREAEEAAWVPPSSVPKSVTPYQARIALLDAGLLPTVEALMADQNTPQSAKIAWEYAVEIQRQSSFIATLAPALNLTSEQIDALFVAAAQVT
jgi:hypothetical protein